MSEKNETSGDNSPIVNGDNNNLGNSIVINYSIQINNQTKVENNEVKTIEEVVSEMSEENWNKIFERISIAPEIFSLLTKDEIAYWQGLQTDLREAMQKLDDHMVKLIYDEFDAWLLQEIVPKHRNDYCERKASLENDKSSELYQIVLTFIKKPEMKDLLKMKLDDLRVSEVFHIWHIFTRDKADAEKLKELKDFAKMLNTKYDYDYGEGDDEIIKV
ncbi:hypothetical protein AGMMS49944_16450 [Spirochaetia bacterium]|nr:hypothetical protein AGMMS49944_16450 [Spirochaetia bacterium]